MAAKKQRLKRTRRFFSSVFNFRLWLDLTNLQNSTRLLKSQAQDLLRPQQGRNRGDFEQVKSRFNLSEQELKTRMRGLLTLSIVMVLFALGILSYAVYQFVAGTIQGGVVSLVLFVLALTLAFRYHFWYFQMKQRKLGCTWQEWLNYVLKGRSE